MPLPRRRDLADAAWAARLQMESLRGLIDHIADETVRLVRGEVSREALMSLSEKTLDGLQALERALDEDAR